MPTRALPLLRAAALSALALTTLALAACSAPVEPGADADASQRPDGASGDGGTGRDEGAPDAFDAATGDGAELDGATDAEGGDGATDVEPGDGATGGDGAGGDGAGGDDASAPPVARVTVTPRRIARGDAFATVVTLDATGSAGASAFAWTIPDGRLEPGSTLRSPVVRVRFAGTADHGFAVRVSNSRGDDAASGVVAINRQPVAVARGGGVLAAGGTAMLDATGSTDPDGDALTYRWTITARPAGSAAALSDMTAARPTLRPDVPGTYALQLVANDGLEDSVAASTNVIADSADRDRPALTVNVTPTHGTPGTTFRVCVNAMDPGGVASRALAIDGAPATLDAMHCATYMGVAVGRHEAVATARDTAGNAASATGAFYVHTAPDNGPPTVSLTAPGDGALVTAPVDVTGTANDADLASYWLEAAPQGRTQFAVFARGTRAVMAGVLAQLSPGAFAPGAYSYRLCADDTWGNRACTPARVFEAAPAPPRPGVVRMGFLDVQYDLLGIPIVVRRVYDSRALVQGDFGFGWTMEVEGAGTFTQIGDPSRGWNETGCTRLPFRPVMVEAAVHRWTVVIGNRVFRFRQTVTGVACFTGGAEVNVGFVAEPGTAGTLTTPGYASTGLTYLRGSGDIVDGEFNPYAPQTFRLAVTNGPTYDLALGRGVTAVTDPAGNRITINRDGIVHSTGATLRIARDTQGRVTRFDLPDGRTRSYRYDGAGDLVGSTDFTAAETRYRYDTAHRLLQIVDPRGNVPGTLEYDADGRIVAYLDAMGRRVTVAHEAGNRTVITDRAGGRTVVVYDARGNVTSSTDALGHETRYTYDANGRVTSETDPLGNVTRFEYDASGNVTAVVDPLMQRTVFTYDAGGRVTSVTDPVGVARRFEYSSSGALTAFVNGLGGRTVYTRSTNGALTAITDPVGQRISMTRDAQGRLTGYTDGGGRGGTVALRPDGQIQRETFSHGGMDATTEYLYDSAGRLTGQRLPNGGMSGLAYDPAGHVTEATSALGHRQRVTRDANDQFTSLQGSDGSSVSVVRDVEGRVTNATLPDGRTVTRTLDALGRPTTVQLPGGPPETVTYDAAGRVASRARGGAMPTRYTYDAAGRVTSVDSPASGLVRYEYDRGGRVTAVVDALGARTELAYDMDGNLTTTRLPGGAVSTITRDVAGRITALTDERGAVTRFTRNGAGEIATVTDASAQTWRYGYDATGQLATAMTPSGASWAFGRDATGQLTSRRLPWGGMETRARDAEGRLTRLTDAAGVAVAYEWDPSGHLTARLPPAAGEAERRTYTTAGQLASVRTTRGVVTYTYDAAGRVRSVTQPGGAFVEYTYDAAGRRASVRTAAGTTRYSYDAATGRLVGVDDDVLGRAGYAYDAVGRLREVSLPDGTVTTYAHDARGFVTSERTTRGATTVRAVTYTRDAAGNVLTATESDGRAVTYAYDAAGRLAREARAGGPDAATLDFGYDADGSLTRAGARTFTVASLRVTSDGATTYTYDAAGRMTGRSGAGRNETFRYDGLGRLVEVTRAGGTPARVQLEYDQNDLLRRVVVDGVGRTLLWDDQAQLPQLIEERGDDGRLLARYVRGVGVVGASSADGARVFHRDAQGHVRAVTRATDGGEVARYAYSAWGENTVGGADTTARLRYAGEYLVPELGLYFLRSRFYDPSLGRFITPDHQEPVVDLPTTFHPYQYAGNNPVTFRDPTGRFSLGQQMAAVAVMNVLAAIATPILQSAIVSVARAFGFNAQATSWVGVNVAVSAGYRLVSGGLQVDYLHGPTRNLFVLWFFLGISTPPVSTDRRIYPVSDQVSFSLSVGPIAAPESEANTDPDPRGVRAGVYVTISGSFAWALVRYASGNGATRNVYRTLPYGRGSLGIQWEVLGFDQGGGVGLGAVTKFSLGANTLDTTDFPDALKEKFLPGSPRARAPSGAGAASISLQVYLPLLWGRVSSSGITIEGDLLDYFGGLY